MARRGDSKAKNVNSRRLNFSDILFDERKDLTMKFEGRERIDSGQNSAEMIV